MTDQDLTAADPEGDDPRADLRWGTIAAAVVDAAARGGDRECIVDGDRRWTWHELGGEVGRATKAFLAAGIEVGDRVAVWAPNSAEWVVALLGLQSAGAVLVPLNTRFKGAEAADILGRSRARVLVTVDGFLDNHYIGMLDGFDLPHLERIVVLRTDEGQDLPPTAERWEAFLAAGEAGEVTDVAVAARRAQVTPDSVADLLFTSGTTGKPKGVICVHAQTLRTVATWANVVGLDETDRYLAINPFFHSFGYKAGIIAWLVTGCVLVPMPVFDVPEAMRLITEQKISMIPGPPTLYQTILNHPDRAQLDSSSLRLAVTGAASVPVRLVEQMRDDLGFDTVIAAYGLTEGCGFATMCRRSDDATTIATTSGRAMPGIEVEVVDEGGTPVRAGEPGEVVIRGYNVMQGYFENPEATAETIDADGWLHTGDVGVMDDRGYLRITDRMKDLFIVGGFNAYPAEIENLLLAHPHIAQVAVIGIPDERMGEVAAAFVVAATGTTPDPAEIIAWSREHMANYKAPRQVHIVEALPFNPGGKVMKFELRNRLQEAPIVNHLLATASLKPGYWDDLSAVTLLVRIIVGATFAAHGYKHIFLGGKLAGTARWFTGLGMKPNGMIHAVLASATELACGIMMIFGFFTPFAAAGYVGVLLVAAWTNHRPHGYWSDSGWEYVSVLGTFAVFLAAVSPGKHSLDWALGLDFSFQPFTAFAIAVVLGLGSGIGLLVAFYRPDAPAASDA